MVWPRIRNHPGLATLLVLLLVLPAPLVWLGSSTNLLDPVLYSAVIEADVVLDAGCNVVSRQVTREYGQQNDLTELEAHTIQALSDHHWLSEMTMSRCVEKSGEFTMHSKFWRAWNDHHRYSITVRGSN